MSAEISIFWFRRDLRLHDNAGLYYALKASRPVLPVFIFDTNILEDLKDRQDKRIQFIYDVLAKMQAQLEKKGSTLRVLHGTPKECFAKLLKEYKVTAVYTNNDYEPYATKRDSEIAKLLDKEGITFHSYKDQVIFEKGEVVKDNGEPYTVFTPYGKKWLQKLDEFYLKSYPTAKYYKHFIKHAPKRMPSLKALGFEKTEYFAVPPKLNEAIAIDYEKTRDIPSLEGTTRLSVHLRFGTVSIRELVRDSWQLNKTLLNELIWREFYQMILWHFPNVVTESFKKEYDNIKWRNNYDEFEKWCNGQTGYPIVDAGMRELNETGFMHNRVRMITASFLAKHLLIDWRWGEAYFGEKLLDYDLAANNGNWQWAAGCGCDAAPYFRIFNPQLQTEKFDPERKYILHWVPELGTEDYPQPIVDHKTARERCLQVYKRALSR
ncbi:cryptochrome/photolyase family protein [Polluticoccus soli]|uniref:cryptochrome/photolyase family protein n=1 Tax=Polluticoccus soli TaxID=3034150 RepID=UPI0023E22B14|nr:deoxyribodipyrimidine photo-lyase [Flavipsychrobacter sp. JY13-12]